MSVSQSDIVSIFVLSALVVLSLTLVIILFVVFYQKRMIHQNMELQLLEQEKQKAMLDATIQSQEVERRRIAKDLHDDVGATLSTVKLHLGQAIKYAEVSKSKSSAEEAKTLIEESIQSVRSISRDLLPATLEKFGLVAGLEELIKRNNGSDNLKLSLSAMEVPTPLDLQTELAIYRITQELINNSIKHARAQHISIKLWSKGQQLCLEYQDDGRGFDAQNPPTMKGMGLRNIHSRVKMINGIAEINTSPGNGFKLTLMSAPTHSAV